jgi:hypothetical protein
MWAWRPTAVVLDEDATPLARIVVWAARQQGATSYVVQHGAPRVRFGFAPLAADRFLAWGESSAAQLSDWNVPREQVLLTGSTQCLPQVRRAHHKRDEIKQILLFATMPPCDARPDAVEYHLTTRAHNECLRMAFSAVQRLSRALLLIKLHPRCADAMPIERLAAEFPDLKCRIVRGTPQRWLRQADVVLNCCSSAGIEAAHCGLPVIELLPAGGRRFSCAAWGLFGAASGVEELAALLEAALTADAPLKPSTRHVFLRTGAAAARAAVNAILGIAARSQTDSSRVLAGPHFRLTPAPQEVR